MIVIHSVRVVKTEESGDRGVGEENGNLKNSLLRRLDSLFETLSMVSGYSSTPITSARIRSTRESPRSASEQIQKLFTLAPFQFPLSFQILTSNSAKSKIFWILGGSSSELTLD